MILPKFGVTGDVLSPPLAPQDSKSSGFPSQLPSSTGATPFPRMWSLSTLGIWRWSRGGVGVLGEPGDHELYFGSLDKKGRWCFFFFRIFSAPFLTRFFFWDDMRNFSKEPDGCLYVFLVRGLGRSLDSRYIVLNQAFLIKGTQDFSHFSDWGISEGVKIRDRDRGTWNPPKSALVGDIGWSHWPANHQIE